MQIFKTNVFAYNKLNLNTYLKQSQKFKLIAKKKYHSASYQDLNPRVRIIISCELYTMCTYLTLPIKKVI